MKRILLAACVLVGATVHAQIHLTPVEAIPIPGNQDGVIDLQFILEPSPYHGPSIVLLTEVEAWIPRAEKDQFEKLFDPIIAGVRLNRDARGVYDPIAQTYYYAGGTFDARIYAYSPRFGVVTNGGSDGQGMTELGDMPAGFAVRNGTGEIFASFGGDPDHYIPTSPALYRYTIGTDTEITGTAFGNSGPGAVSSQVGAIVIGPDGKLNVLDAGLEKILRYDLDTLEYIDSITLFNETIDNRSFAISSTGYVFVSDDTSLSGSIYDYVTGALVGTYAAPNTGAYGLGRLAMTADDFGNVYWTNVNVSRNLEVFSTASIPEPAHLGLVAGGLLAGIALLRRWLPQK